MIHFYRDEIASFDLDSRYYTASFADIPFTCCNGVDKYYSPYTCLTNTQTHLIALGGMYDYIPFKTMDHVFTFNLQSSYWDNFIPYMLEQRRAPSCIFVQDYSYLYAIAGEGSRTIEKINVNNPSTWTFINSLSTNSGGAGTRTVLFDRLLYVIGGHNDGSAVEWIDTVHTIRPIDDRVMLMSDMTLPYPMAYSACTVTSDAIWCAGGRTVGDYVSVNTIIRYAELCEILSHFYARCNLSYTVQTNSISHRTTDTINTESNR